MDGRQKMPTHETMKSYAPKQFTCRAVLERQRHVDSGGNENETYYSILD